MKIQPLLTPDNYAKLITDLIASAKTKLYFQNQYIHIPARGTPNPAFQGLLNALRDKIDQKLDVRIILRDLGDTRTMIESLQQFGIPSANVKLQKACHNKGIIVDSQTLALGSHNWSQDGTTANRDATLIIYDERVAAYYEKIFLYDWTTLARQRSSGETAMPRGGSPSGRSRASKNLPKCGMLSPGTHTSRTDRAMLSVDRFKQLRRMFASSNSHFARFTEEVSNRSAPRRSDCSNAAEISQLRCCENCGGRPRSLTSDAIAAMARSAIVANASAFLTAIARTSRRPAKHTASYLSNRIVRCHYA